LPNERPDGNSTAIEDTTTEWTDKERTHHCDGAGAFEIHTAIAIAERFSNAERKEDEI